MLYTYDNKQEYKRAFLQELGIKVSAELFILVEDEEKKMVTGELKNKIDSLWEIFWTGGSDESAGGNRADDVSDVHPGSG